MPTISLPTPPSVDHLGFFRFARVADRTLLTGDTGAWLFLDDADFQRLLRDDIGPDDPLHAELHERGFLRSGIDLDALADRVRRKRAFLGRGPHLHVVVVTRRCNQACRYCHASRTDLHRTDTDMSLETALEVVKLAFKSSGKHLLFEFQGGEPMLNFPAIQLVVDTSLEQNRHEGKLLQHSLVTNLTQMTDERADWLVDRGVQLCTSLDGPRDLHDFNRTWTGGAAYDNVVHWMDAIRDRYVARGLDPDLWHVDALMTTTRQSLGQARAIVDAYLERGLKSISLRSLNPYGFAAGTWKAIGYTAEQWLAFYEEALDYILELNRAGTELVETTAATVLMKMLTPDDPNFVDLRSPCGAGLGQVAYDHDGGVYPCDEARMLAAMGDRTLELGKSAALDGPGVVRHPTVKAMAVASLLDSLPACSDCWNLPYCGVCPVHAYKEDGDLFGQRPASRWCREKMGVSRLLFERLADDDGTTEAIFRRWTVRRPREDCQG